MMVVMVLMVIKNQQSAAAAGNIGTLKQKKILNFAVGWFYLSFTRPFTRIKTDSYETVSYILELMVRGALIVLATEIPWEQRNLSDLN